MAASRRIGIILARTLPGDRNRPGDIRRRRCCSALGAAGRGERRHRGFIQRDARTLRPALGCGAGQGHGLGVGNTAPYQRDYPGVDGGRHDSSRWVRPPRDSDPFPFDLAVSDNLYFTRSSDMGWTWGQPEPVSISALAYSTHVGKTGIVELPDGSSAGAVRRVDGR